MSDMDTSSSNGDGADASTPPVPLTSTALPDEVPDEFAGTPIGEPPSEAEVADLAEPSSAWALLKVFHHRNYRLFFSGQLVSLMGTWMQSVAQGWLVYSLTHSPFLLGLTSFCAQVTVFFIAPFGGLIADRVDRRKMLFWTQGLSMIQATLLAALTLADVIHVWEIVALAFGLGLINAFDIPTRQSMTLDMVGRGDLRHAIALNSMMFNLARVIGPALAGLLLKIAGAGVCFSLNAISFAAVLTSLFFMRSPARPPRLNRNALREVVDGYRYSLSQPEIRSALMLVGVSSCFGAAYLTLLPAFARDLLGGDATTLGTLWSSIGLGALVGAYALSRIREHWLVLAPILSSAAFGLCLTAFAHSHLLWLSAALLLPTAFSLMLLGGTTNTIIQLTAKEQMRGRVISHYTQSFLGMLPWGSLMLGYFAGHFGVSNAVTFGGAVVMVSAAIAYFNRSDTVRIVPSE
jgi:MFS family permease